MKSTGVLSSIRAAFWKRLDCAVMPGDAVEFGCGYGTFTIAAAGMISGRVFALDIEPTMIAETARKSAEAGLANVVVEERDVLLYGSGRPDGSAAYAMLFNILHVEHPIGLLREAHRVLKPGGSIGIIHWRMDIPTPRGPSPVIRPQPAQCRTWAEAAGFQYVRDEALCCCSWHWGLVMRKSRIHKEDTCDAAPSPTSER